MEARELRIGNVVHATIAGRTNEPLQEYVIQSGADIDNAHWYFPIPLTEDWLVRFGGIQGDNNIYNSCFYCFEFDSVTVFISTGGTVELCKNKYSEQSVKLNRKYFFVHDFQNLIYSLTGESLTPNTKPTKN